MGERKHTEGKVSRRQKRQAPPADSETAKSAGDKKGKPPCGFRNGKVSRRQKRQASLAHRQHPRPRAAEDKPPLGAWFAPLLRCPLRFSPRGCKGRSPLHEITLILPLPAGKGVGGMGERKHTEGRDSRRQRRQAPLRIPKRQSQQATKKASPPSPPAPPKNHPLG